MSQPLNQPVNIKFFHKLYSFPMMWTSSSFLLGNKNLKNKCKAKLNIVLVLTV